MKRTRENWALEALREANPVTRATLKDKLSREERGQRLEAAINKYAARTAHFAHDEPRKGHVLRKRPAIVAAAGCLVAVALTVLVALLPADSDSPVGAPSGLRALAAVAESRPETVPGPGEFAYQSVRFTELVLDERIERTTRSGIAELWISAAGHGTLKRNFERKARCRDAEESLRSSLGLGCAAGASPVDAVVAPQLAPPLTGTDPGVLDLPTEDEELRSALTAEVRRKPASERFFIDRVDRDVELFTLIGGILSNPLASPELRAALFRVIAEIHGIGLKEGVPILGDRTGTVATVTGTFDLPDLFKAGRGEFPGGKAVVRYEIAFDPETSGLLSTRTVLLELDAPGLEATGLPELETPVPIDERVVLASAIVDSQESRYQTAQRIDLKGSDTRSVIPPALERNCPAAAGSLEDAGWDAAAIRDILPKPRGGGPCPSTAELEAVIEFCPDEGEDECRIVGVGADDEDTGPMTAAESLAREGMHPEECPEAAGLFEDAGIPVSAFLGRCPTTQEAERLISGE